jgi:E3 ubiquitin-protein ligase RAD18
MRNKRLREASNSRSQSPTKSRRVSEERIEVLDSDDIEGEVEEEIEGAELNEDGVFTVYSVVHPFHSLINCIDEGECPLCQASMPISKIPMHIEKGCPPPRAKTKNEDGVEEGGDQKSRWRKMFSGQSAGIGKEKNGKEKV